MFSRRDFIAGVAGSAGALALAAARPAGATPGFAPLTARRASVQLAPDGYPETGIWGFDGLAPGPVLRVPQGRRLQRRFVNDLPQASSIHWHGIRIENPMDGVPDLTQPAVAPGETFDYDFAVPDAGTYWYHSHNQSVEQVARGLHGVLIVDEPVAPDVDRDEVLVIDDWLIDPDTAQIDADFNTPFDRSHGGRSGNLLLTNGTYDLTMTARRNERMRLRIVNVANARIFALGLQGLDGWTMALDGMPLPAPEPIEAPILLGPGQRVDLIVDVTADEGGRARVMRVSDDPATPQVTFDIRGAASLARRPAPAPLPPNADNSVPLDGSEVAVTLDMEGGAMGRLRAASLDGQDLSFRDLAARNRYWAFNGVVGMTETPLLEVDRGQPVRLMVANDTAFPHAMHLHGMHFRELGAGQTLGPLRDTLLIGGGQRREIAFRADNPGDWLFHCHMLSHAAAGMMTWMRVA